MTEPIYDIAIIGGGINGAGIARDAAGRGLKVLLLEQGDIAQATSSASSKLVHGGLRYLEQYAFKLVREALNEREILLRIAPHLVHPCDFVLPHTRGMRPAWMLHAGVRLYDALASHRSLRSAGAVELAGKGIYGAPLKSAYQRGFRYADCTVDDARLVLVNALDAARHGADIRPHHRCTAAIRTSQGWQLHFVGDTTQPQQASARIVVNAAGPWANNIAEQAGIETKGTVRRVRGSHILVPRVHDSDHAYILQMPDKRIVFLIPFEEQFTLIGTTDVACEDDPMGASISPEETAYLLEGANRYLATPLTESDIVWSYAGVRALYYPRSQQGADKAAYNPSAASRDYVLELDAHSDAPFLSVFGGKLTTYRSLAEQVMRQLQPYLPRSARAGWTHNAALPGGESYYAPTWLSPTLAARWQRSYGSLISHIIGEAQGMEQLGEAIAPDVYEAELHYVRQHEWVRSAEDFLWRRTKLGLMLARAQQQAIADWFAAHQH